MADDEIRAALHAINERITGLSLLTVALQTLLQESGVISKAQVDARVEELRGVFSKRLRRNLAERREQQARDELRLLLERYQGTRQ